MDGKNEVYKKEHFFYKVYKPIINFLAKILFKTKITPNQITTFGIILSIITGIFFALGEWKYLIIGAFLSQVVIISDFLDGIVARYKKTGTVFGEIYDRFSNKIFRYFMFLGAMIGAYQSSNDYFILIIGAIAIFNTTAISFVSDIKLYYNFRKDYSELPKSKNLIFSFSMISIFALAVFAVFNALTLFLWLYAMSGTFGWIKQIYSYYKLRKYINKKG